MNLNLDTKSFKEIKSVFSSINAWGLLSSIDLKACDPQRIRSKGAITEYVIQLCDCIHMKRFGEPRIVHFGEDEKVAGFSLTQLIETSLISGHFANLTNSIYLDVFSCKLYDPYKVAEFTKEYFHAEQYRISVLFRQ